MILVDSSAWVEYDRATGSTVDRRLFTLIQSTGKVAVTEPVVMEVVAGARDDARERQLRDLLDRFHLIPFNAAVHFDGAVRTYRECRKAGITPRGLIDCMIAAVAIDCDVPVLAHDRDFARLANTMNLRLDPDSLGA